MYTMKKLHIKWYLGIPWKFVTIGWGWLLVKLNIQRDTSIIPPGVYCYTWDTEKNEKEPIDGYCIKPCPYYKSLPGSYTGCSYVGFAGHDLLLWDQCKICGEDKDYDESEEQQEIL